VKLHLDEPGVVAVYDALDEFRDRCLRRLKSAFLPDDHRDVDKVWTAASAHELIDKFIDRPDEGARSFIDKLRDQLVDASTASVQLLTELAWLHFVIAIGIRPETKSARVQEIADIGGAVTPNGRYAEAFARGLTSTGTSFSTRRPNQLWLLIRFAARWTSASSPEREHWLADPWAFREMVFELDGLADQTQRHALIHLVHPDTFEDCVSRNHKRAMAELAEPHEVGDNVDRTIANVRARLSTEYGEGFNFYGDAVRKLWAEAEVEADPATVIAAVDDADVIISDRSAWLVRGSGGERVPEWLDRGICSISFEDTFPFDLRPGATRDELREQAESVGVDVTSGGFNAELGQVWRFVNMVEIGDYVVTVNGQDVYLGIVESGPRNIGARTRKQTERSVEWLNAERPVRRKDVAPAMYSKMRTLLTLSNITSVIDELERWVDEQREQVDGGVSVPMGEVELAAATSAFADELFLPTTWLQRVIDLLEEKRQVVFYGPPGTGKTFVAQAIADHVTAAGGTTELVQFHPSYTYEDFFEGYRPVPATAGSVAFEIKPGPLRRLAETALAEPHTPHVLIIDEINRANLAKVFGELYYLLEYRDKVITLQYSDEEFVLPNNLFVIGTMNTADRSIALVDAAMRRRFYFIELAPTTSPISDLLGMWLKDKGMSDLPARLLAELNRRIEDPDAAIGPSYFMTSAIADVGRIERIWDHAIVPLIEERFYGTGRNLDAFSYRSVLNAVENSEP
jgi:5-methylcytosine-specific restriction enzyme B